MLSKDLLHWIKKENSGRVLFEMKRYITHVRKDDNDNIIAVKTYELILTTPQVVERIKKRVDNFYVEVDSAKVSIGVYKEKWIRTYADNKWTNNLDNLPRF